MMIIFHKRILALIGGAVLASTLAAGAQVQPGATVSGAIDQTFNSKSAQVGQPFRLTNAYSANSDLEGATLYGHISEVQSGGAGRKGQIKLAIDRINTKSGHVYRVSATVTNVKVNTKSNAGREAGATAAGALVGGLIGKGWGAVIGGAGGFLVAKNVHEDVTIPEGALVTVQLNSVRRQSP